MVQANYTIENAAGAIVRANLNAALAAIQSANSGGTAPSDTRAGMLWLDTSANPPVLRIRNAGDSGWIALGTIDAAGFQLAGTTGAGRILIGAANAEAQRTALGLGALATGTKASHRVSNPLHTDTTPWLWAGADVAAAVDARVQEVAQGTPGAPRISINALQGLAPGDVLKAGRVTSGDYRVETKLLEWGFIQSGEIRISANHRKGQSGGGHPTLEFRKNGSVVASFTISSTSFAPVSADILVAPGDTLSVHAAVGSDRGHRIQNLSLMTDGGDLWPSITTQPYY